MELVKTIVRLSLSESLTPWFEMVRIMQVLGESPNVHLQGPPVVMDLKEKKQRLSLHIRAIELEQEGMSSIEESTVVALDKMTEGNEVSKFSEVRRVWHEAMYIEPYALPFHEILILVKNRFVRASELADVCTDVGIIFDQAEGDTVKHYEFGPMRKEQLLSMYLNWPKDGLPENFVFLHLKYEQNKAFTFDREYLRKLLEAANEWEVSQAQWFFSYLREKGD
jgi:hypothetical protein